MGPGRKIQIVPYETKTTNTVVEGLKTESDKRRMYSQGRQGRRYRWGRWGICGTNFQL